MLSISHLTENPVYARKNHYEKVDIIDPALTDNSPARNGLHP